MGPMPKVTYIDNLKYGKELVPPQSPPLGQNAMCLTHVYYENR